MEKKYQLAGGWKTAVFARPTSKSGLMDERDEKQKDSSKSLHFQLVLGKDNDDDDDDNDDDDDIAQKGVTVRQSVHY